MGRELGGAEVDLLAEDRLGLIDLARQVDRVVAKPGEEEDGVPAAGGGAGGEGPGGIAEGLRGAPRVARDGEAAVLEGLAAGLEGPGDVGEGVLGVPRLQVV